MKNRILNYWLQGYQNYLGTLKLEEIKKELINELKSGEALGFVKKFDRKLHLKKLHTKHL